MLHECSRGFLETNITRSPLRRRISCLYPSQQRFLLSFKSIYVCNQSINIRPSNCELPYRANPVHLAAICSRLHVAENVQVGCHSFCFELKPTIYSSGLPTSFCYHLAHLFHNSKPWLHLQLSHVGVDPNRAERQALDLFCHMPTHSSTKDASSFTATLPMQTLEI